MAGLLAPNNVTAVVTSVNTTDSTCDILVTWNINEGLHPGAYTVTLEGRVDGGTWAILDEFITSDFPTTTYTHEDKAVNHLYGYRVYWECDDCGGASPFSGEGTVAVYIAAPSDTVTLSDSVNVGFDDQDTATCTDTITLSESVAIAPAYVVSPSDTITLSDRCIAGSTLKTNYAYYFGTVDGDINKLASSYYADGSTAILTTWRSKETDFSDQYPQYLDDRKMIDRVRLVYVDKTASTPVTIKVSTDGGATWTASSASIGTGSGAVKDYSFWYNLSGRYFQFEVESSSSTTAFQWISLEPQFLAAGEYWEVS